MVIAAGGASPKVNRQAHAGEPLHDAKTVLPMFTPLDEIIGRLQKGG